MLMGYTGNAVGIPHTGAIMQQPIFSVQGQGGMKGFRHSAFIKFSQDMDAASLTPDTFVLERSGGDGTFDDGNEIPIVAAAMAVI